MSVEDDAYYLAFSAVGTMSLKQLLELVTDAWQQVTIEQADRDRLLVDRVFKELRR
jgi:hypothetical protein